MGFDPSRTGDGDVLVIRVSSGVSIPMGFEPDSWVSIPMGFEPDSWVSIPMGFEPDS